MSNCTGMKSLNSPMLKTHLYKQCIDECIHFCKANILEVTLSYGTNLQQGILTAVIGQ